MENICPICGLSKDLCVCKTLRKAEVSRIKVYTVKAKFGKFMTVVKGIERKDLRDVFKMLKRGLACGGALKEDLIYLQGDHKSKIINVMTKLGYNKENIEVE